MHIWVFPPFGYNGWCWCEQSPVPLCLDIHFCFSWVDGRSGIAGLYHIFNLLETAKLFSKEADHFVSSPHSHQHLLLSWVKENGWRSRQKAKREFVLKCQRRKSRVSKRYWLPLSNSAEGSCEEKDTVCSVHWVWQHEITRDISKCDWCKTPAHKVEYQILGGGDITCLCFSSLHRIQKICWPGMSCCFFTGPWVEGRQAWAPESSLGTPESRWRRNFHCSLSQGGMGMWWSKLWAWNPQWELGALAARVVSEKE